MLPGRVCLLVLDKFCLFDILILLADLLFNESSHNSTGLFNRRVSDNFNRSFQSDIFFNCLLYFIGY